MGILIGHGAVVSRVKIGLPSESLGHCQTGELYIPSLSCLWGHCQTGELYLLYHVYVLHFHDCKL